MALLDTPAPSSFPPGAAALALLPSPQEPAPAVPATLPAEVRLAQAAQAVLDALGAYLLAASWQSWAHRPVAEAAWTRLANAWRRYEVERILADQERRHISGEDV